MPSAHAAARPVAVIGALNVDLVVRVPRLPHPGETVVGTDLERHAGGKGGNQAVAAARAGAAVRMVGAVGSDPDGAWLLGGLESEGVEIAHVERATAATGAALIAVASDGQNQIAVAPGANARLTEAGFEQALAGAGLVLVSLEIPLEIAVHAARIARDSATQLILNPSPAQPLPPALLDADPIVVANSNELAAIWPDGVATVRRVVETRGAEGVRLSQPDGALELPAYAAEPVVDTTGAGDTFCGVLAAWLAQGAGLGEASTAANLAAGLSVTQAGARSGMPHRDRIVALLAGHASR